MKSPFFRRASRRFRQPVSRRPALGLEAFEQRALLAVVANPDSYTTNEDTSFTTGSTVIFSRASTGWLYNDDILDSGNAYPSNTTQPGVAWNQLAFRTVTAEQAFGEWTAATGPFENSGGDDIDAFDTGPAPTVYNAPQATEKTVVARRNFTLTAGQAAAANGSIDYACDDGCVFYINGTEVFRTVTNNASQAILPAAPAPITVTTVSANSNDEAAYKTQAITIPGGLLQTGDNVLAIEVHHRGGGTDSGFDVSLSLNVGTPGLGANDNLSGAVGTITFTIDLQPVDNVSGNPAGTITLGSSGNFTFVPTPNYPNPANGDSGAAHFFYTVTDQTSSSQTTSTITVTSINDVPVARNDQYAGVEGGTVTVSGTMAGAVYLAPGSTWFYSDNGSDQNEPLTGNPEWNDGPGAGFDPSTGVETGWVSTPGAAELGYGDTDEATTVNCDPDPLDGCVEAPTNLNDNYITTYFWRKFDVAGAIPAQLKIGLKRDDGGIVYINGVEVFRSNMPASAVNYLTPAAGNTTSETTFFETVVDTANLGLLVSGNTIAVEIHQQNAGSSDISFDLRLSDGNEGLLVNDSDVESASLTVVVDDQSQFAGKGTLTVNPNGTLSFAANPGVSGTFAFTYHVTDTNIPPASSNIATATIRLRPINAGPYTANDDTFSTPEDTPLVVTGNGTAGSPGGGLMANDSHLGDESDPVTISITTQPTHGTVTLDGNTGGFTYTPAANYNGPDSFTYQVDDGFGSVDTAIVNLTVSSVNDPPVAVNDAYTATEDTALVATSATAPSPTVILPQGSTWDFLDQITNGTNGTPAESYPLDAQGDAWNEPDFDIGTSDTAIGTWESGSGLFAMATIDCCTTATTLDGNADENTVYLFRRSLTITPAQAAEIAARGLRVRYAVDDGAVVYLGGLEVQRINMPASPAVIDANTRATATGNEGTAGSGVLPSFFDIPPTPIPAGTYTVAVEVHQVAPPSTDVGFDVQVEIPADIAGILANDSDAENDPITAITITPGRGVRHGALALNPNGTFTYTPSGNYFGTDAFEYTITAGGQTSAPATVTFTVNGTNDNPTPAADAYSVGSTQILEASLATWDANRTAVGVNTLLAAGSSWSYKDDGSDQDTLNPGWKLSGFNPAAAGWSGPSPAELGFGDGDEATLITAGNITYYFAGKFNLPSTAGISQILVHFRRDDGGSVYLNGNQIVRDNLVAVHPFNQLAGFQTGSETAYHTFLVPVTLGMLVVGDNYVAAEVHQQALTSSDVSFDLAITTPFAPPTNQFGVRANDTDPDNHTTVTLAVTVPPSQHEGTFTLNNDGTFTYNPVDSFSGTDSFEYSYTTSSGTATATVTINVGSSCGFNADLNGSGNVNRADVVILLGNYGRSSGVTPADGDIDCDGDVDANDLSRLQAAYTGGSPSPSAPAAVVATTRDAAAAAVDRALRTPVRTASAVRAALRSATGTTSAARNTAVAETAQTSARTLRASRSPRNLHAAAVDSLFTSGG